MFRLAVLSDIHGNLPALEAVIADMQSFEPDHVVVAGDLINGAAFNEGVVERVVTSGWAHIRGNHEFYLLNYDTPRVRPDLADSPVPPFLKENIGPWYNTIATMPDELTLYLRDVPPVRVVHGLPGDNVAAITPYTDEEHIRTWLADVEETMFIAGHYHIGFERHVDRWHILNPGPVGIPADGITKASYVILDGNSDGWKATFRRVPYDIQAVVEAHERHNLSERLGIFGYLSLKQFLVARPLINAYFRWHHQHHPDEPHSQELADTFLATDQIWENMGEHYQVHRELMPQLYATLAPQSDPTSSR